MEHPWGEFRETEPGPVTNIGISTNTNNTSTTETNIFCYKHQYHTNYTTFTPRSVVFGHPMAMMFHPHWWCQPVRSYYRFFFEFPGYDLHSWWMFHIFSIVSGGFSLSPSLSLYVCIYNIYIYSIVYIYIYPIYIYNIYPIPCRNLDAELLGVLNDQTIPWDLRQSEAKGNQHRASDLSEAGDRKTNRTHEWKQGLRYR